MVMIVPMTIRMKLRMNCRSTARSAFSVIGVSVFSSVTNVMIFSLVRGFEKCILVICDLLDRDSGIETVIGHILIHLDISDMFLGPVDDSLIVSDIGFFLCVKFRIG